MTTEELATLARSLTQLSGKPMEPVRGGSAAPETPAIASESSILALAAPLAAGDRKALRSLADLLGRSAAAAEALLRRVEAVQEENRKLAAENALLAGIAERDSLTSLYSKRYILDKLEAEMQRAVRFRTPLSIVMVDLDHFKGVNDVFGHLAGDAVLRAVARVLRESCRVYDIAGRFGGDEFCVMLPSTDLESSVPVAERIRVRLEELRPMADSDAAVTASLGIASTGTVPGEGLFDPAGLIERADRALYRAKNAGRNLVEVWAGGLPEGEH